MPAEIEGTIACGVELFGVARLAASRASIDLTAPVGATLAAVLAELARACPALAGRAIVLGYPDRSECGRPSRGYPQRPPQSINPAMGDDAAVTGVVLAGLPAHAPSNGAPSP